jgi:hypothetical protein
MRLRRKLKENKLSNEKQKDNVKTNPMANPRILVLRIESWRFMYRNASQPAITDIKRANDVVRSFETCE